MDLSITRADSHPTEADCHAIRVVGHPTQADSHPTQADSHSTRADSHPIGADSLSRPTRAHCVPYTIEKRLVLEVAHHMRHIQTIEEYAIAIDNTFRYFENMNAFTKNYIFSL